MDLEKVIDLYYQKIYKLCLFYLKDEQESQDLLQEIFLKVIKKQSSFKGKAGIYTWLYRIAVNTLINHIKRKKILKFISFKEEDSENKINNEEHQIDPAHIQESEEIKLNQMLSLEKALETLSGREKTAFYLFYYEQRRQVEISEIMNTSISAVEYLIHKGKKKIRNYFSQVK